MERLTIDTKILFCDIAQCRETPGGSFCEDGYCDQRRVYERLREYERIGLAPEEIMVKDDILMCAAIVLGASVDHIRTLLAAEKEGRVVVLPCARNGAELYFADAFRGEIYKEAYTAGLGLFWTNDSDIGDYVPLSCIGKTIFLTRDEAEAALKGAVDHETD